MRTFHPRRAPFVLAAALLLAIAHVGVVSWAVYRTRTPIEAKLAVADRVMYYAFDEKQGPLFALSGKEHTLRFVTHALLGDRPWDPHLDIAYGVRLTLLRPGIAGIGSSVIWSKDVYVRTRASKSGLDGRFWRNENAFAVAGDVLVSDARSFEVDLPDPVPIDAILGVKLTGPSVREAAVKLYEIDPLTGQALEAEKQARSPESLARTAGRVTFEPFDTLTPIESGALLSRTQKRIPAGGERGHEYDVRQIFTTPYRDEISRLDADAGVIVDRLHAAAINVAGPASITLEVSRASVEHASGAASLEVHAIPAALLRGASSPAWSFPVTERAHGERVDVPAGLHSIELTSSAPFPVRVRASAPLGTRGFATPAWAWPLDATPARAQALVPEFTSTETWMTGAAGIDLDLAQGEGRAPALRFDAWAPLPTGAAVSSASLIVELADSAGKALAREESFVASPRAPFDRVAGSAGSIDPVSEKVEIRVALPPGAARAHLTSTRPLALRVFAQRPRTAEDDRLESPFADAGLDGTIWRYAPRRTPGWNEIAPNNQAGLVDSGQRAAIVATVRLQPGEPAPVPTPAEPIAETEKQRLVDRERSDRLADAVANWSAGLFTSLGEKPVAIDLGRKTGGGASIEWLCAPSDEGKPVELLVDGRSVARFALSGANGTWRVPRIAPGIHALSVRTSAHAHVLIDQPPAVSALARDIRLASTAPVALPAPPPVVHARVAHRLAPHESLVLRVDKPDRAPETVDLVVYAPDAAPVSAARLHVWIDRGAREAEERTYSLPAPDVPFPAVIPALGGSAAGYPRLVTVSLGASIAAGPHTLEVATVGVNETWWTRASIAPNGPPDPAAHVAAGRSAAFTLEGPATLALHVSREKDDARAAAAGEIRVDDVPARLSQPAHWTIPLPRGNETANLSISIPAGVHSLLVSTASAETWRVVAASPAGSALPFGGRSAIALADGQAIPPDVRRTQLFVASPTGPPVVIDTGTVESPALRVDAWVFRDGGTASIYAGFEDGAKTLLTRDDLYVRSTRSAFDRALLSDGGDVAVSDPITFRVIKPAGATRMILSASAPVAVRVYAEPPTPPGIDVLESPWRDVFLSGTVWRNAPHESRSWLPLLPVNQRALIDAGAWASLLAQVRLERAPTPVAGVVIEPAEETEQQTALENVPRDRVPETLASFDPGTSASLPLRTPVAYDFGRASPGRASIQYSTPLSGLGKKVELTVDDSPAGSWTLTTARGSWALPALTRGRHVVLVSTAAKDLRLLIDQPPLSEEVPLYKARTVHALGSRPLVFRVEKHSREAVTLGVVAYVARLAPSALPGLRVRIDHGAPKRIDGSAAVSAGTRTLALPTADIPQSARIVSLQNRDAGYPRLFPVILGGDLPAGMHTVEITSLQSSAGWARAFVVDPAAPLTDRARQGGLLEPVNVVGPSDE